MKYVLTFATMTISAIGIATTVTGSAIAQDVPQTANPSPSGKGGGPMRLRDRVVPFPEDIELIKRGSAFMLAGRKDAATLVFKIVDGKIVYEVIGGSITKTKRAAIDAVVAEMQKNIGE